MKTVKTYTCILFKFTKTVVGFQKRINFPLLFVEYVVNKMCGTPCLVGKQNPDTSCCRYIVKQLAMFEISKALGTSLKKQWGLIEWK